MRDNRGYDSLGKISDSLSLMEKRIVDPFDRNTPRGVEIIIEGKAMLFIGTFISLFHILITLYDSTFAS